MKLPRSRHRWNLTPAKAIGLQRHLAGELLHSPLVEPPDLVAGGDASFSIDGRFIVAGWVVWDRHRDAVVDQAIARRRVCFPYVPGLLSFREAPSLIAAARKLKIEPDVFMLDGQGLAHPRRFGLACHVGWFIDRPTLGCAKSRLCGTPRLDRLSTWRPDAVGFFAPTAASTESRRLSLELTMRDSQSHPRPRAALSESPPPAAAPACPLMEGDEQIGWVLWTRPGAEPVYVSVGHRITLQHAVAVTLLCRGRYRLPQPARLAHQLVTRHRE